MLTRALAIAALLVVPQQAGRVAFPTSTTSTAAQARFETGLAWLHNFGYDEAIEEFRKAQALDPGFAMAYWGEAICHYRPVFRIENLTAGRAVLAKLGASAAERQAKAVTARERAYIEAAEVLFGGPGDQNARHAAFAEALRRIFELHKDVDAAALYALALIGMVPVGVYDDPRLERAGAAAERALALNPKHPGAAHAVIHAYDDRERAPRALEAAKTYAAIAWSSSHARHMPAHVFVQLGRWAEAVASDEAAWEAAVSHASERGLSASQRDYHPLSWLVYEYVQQGRFDRSRNALKPLEEALKTDPKPWITNELATWRAYYIVGSERWAELANRHAFDNADELFALGYAAAKSNDLKKASATLDVMRKVAATDAVPSRRELAVIMERQLAAAISAAAGTMEAALAAARSAAELEDKMPRSTGRPHPVKSSHELYGELLLQAKRPAEARTQFERSLWRVSNRSSSVIGLARAAAAAGDIAAARKHAELFLSNWRLADQGRPEIVEARQLTRLGK
jgi:tetratricopeptide (TPR) repeat protein